jgi:HEAT repeat protein
MGRRRRILLAVLAGVGAVLLCWVVGSVWLDRPLVYEGRTVTEWSLDLLSPEPSVRTKAAHTLPAIEPSAVPALSRQLQRRDSWLRNPFMAVSSQLPVSWRRAFVRFYHPFRAMDERLAAVNALALFGTNAPADLLIATLRDPERQLANQAAVALSRCGPAAVPGLTLALRDPNPEVRSLACSTLSQIGRPAASAAPELAALLSDPDPQLVALAAHALTTVGPEAVPHLVAALNHPLPMVREKAAFALGQLGYSARSALPALEQSLEDENPGVRKYARAALRAIAPRQYQ